MKTLLFLSISILCSLHLFSQVDRSSDLYKTLQSKDSLLFNIGFNTCDISRFEDLVSNSFEFYHDQAGITGSKKKFIAGIRDGICKLDYRPRRELLENSLQVFPLEKNGTLYGAVQMGEHNFYALEKDKPTSLTSTAKFTHIWLLENGNWRLSRAISYDHQDKEPPIDEKLLFHDKKETEKWLRQKHIPTLGIGYIRNGKIEQVSVFGDLEKGKPAPVNTIWNVASMTKPVTALVALKLVNAGKWSLDEPVSKYYTDPDLVNDPRAKKLTTRHILSHQTGFPNWRYKNPDGKLAFEFDPGTKYQYSGEGYEYLRKALEKKFSTSLDKLASAMIFTPLHMTDTRFYWDESVDSTRFAKWHKENGSQYTTYKNTSANAADDLLTSVEDYCRFMVHVMNGAGLSDTLYKEMLAAQVRINDSKYWGLGWWVDEHINSSGDFALVHGGDDIGLHTIAFIVPKTKDGLLIFTNADNGTSAFADVLLAFLGKEGKGILEVEMK